MKNGVDLSPLIANKKAPDGKENYTENKELLKLLGRNPGFREFYLPMGFIPAIPFMLVDVGIYIKKLLTGECQLNGDTTPKSVEEYHALFTDAGIVDKDNIEATESYMNELCETGITLRREKVDNYGLSEKFIAHGNYKGTGKTFYSMKSWDNMFVPGTLE